MVSELMILANECAARYARQHSVPIIYRTQRALDPAVLQAAEALSATVRPFHLLRFMAAAQYTADAGAHAGLGLPLYCHATSPIRRFSDMVAHRQIKAQVAGQPLPYTHAQVASCGGLGVARV